ncbi:hypothetical protein SESBI_16863 [Sesbania bispinosa]|nr:hypothetical protein SESBI_16863 [Sesbania bispinosa]
MVELRHQQVRYSNNDVNVRSIDNNLWVWRSRNAASNWYSPYEASSRGKKTVNKAKSTWWWNDPERKRQRRVAKYKLYATEGKFKHSVKKGWRWFKVKCIKIVTNL